jgi:hypothetical protein
VERAPRSLPAIGCGSCDADRGILCLSCYSRTNDPRLPSPYAEYFSWAAGYPRKIPRRPIPLRPLAFILVAATTFSYAQIGQVRAEVDGWRSRAAVIRDPFAQLRQTTNCIDQAFHEDLGLALERAVRGEQVGECAAFAR